MHCVCRADGTGAHTQRLPLSKAASTCRRGAEQSRAYGVRAEANVVVPQAHHAQPPTCPNGLPI